MKGGRWWSGSAEIRQAGGILIVCCTLILFSPGMIPGTEDRDERWAIIITGVTGDPDLQKAYLKEIEDLHSLLTRQMGFQRDRIEVLFDDPSKNPALIGRKSTRENLHEVCRKFASRVEENDLVFIFIDGHGSYDGKVYKLNLVGPDPTAEEVAEMINLIPARRSIIVNATSCSGGSMAALSRKGRVVITATKSGMERNRTHAGKFFIEAFTNAAADSDKDGRVSLMEAFSYMKQRVEAYYKSEGNLQTEHPVFDDNGDGEARDQFSPDHGEGFLARAAFLDKAKPIMVEGELTPEKQALAKEAQDLERQIETLKAAKGDMPEAEYEKRLEELLLKLAKVNAKLRK